ncbi:MAG: GH3 auxin-responsive promoter family protein [Dehalococcoidales bacterium]|nr:GH3 auxin-responsive promoter family protein [Dehalococcoidales bacterium]
MPEAVELLRDGRTTELWGKYCGFVNLDIEQFMGIQQQLLLEQLELLQKCELGKKLLHGAHPGSIEEFRERVPITTYADYTPYLPDQIEAALPEKPMLWQRTSGRSAELSFKWVPVTQRLYRELGDAFLALLLFASCKERGEVAIREHDKFLYGLAPPPYASGCWAHRLADESIFDFLPPIETVESMPFQQRLEEGFKMGMSEGIDMMAGLSIMLVAIGERFGQGGGLKRVLPMLTKPKLLSRMLRAMIKSKMAGRKLLPRDVWTLKGLVSSGTDSQVYRERIKEMWGRYPLDVYGATECVMVAMQTWDYGDMTFLPYFNLLEFMPEKDYARWALDHTYLPATRLLNEVVPGERYVIVLTNFHGGAFVRYMLNDMVQITALRNARLNINIPQMIFYSRADNILDFGGASLTEKVVWQAIENSGLDYVDWVARKEKREGPILHIYLELRNGSRDIKEITTAIDKQLRLIKEDYASMVGAQGFNLLEVSLLPGGAFQGYIAKRQAAGSDPAHLKPPHINPADGVLSTLTGEESKTVSDKESVHPA